ncbi:MAG: CHAT domain-containing protein [Saprospiraceae bacterium]|nr:CHAT domain-containing protein [Saprospiraceae bacterium]
MYSNRLFFCCLILLLSGSLIAQKAENLLDQAHQLSQDHQYMVSSQLADAYVKQHPNRMYDKSEAYHLLAYNYLQMGRYDEALDWNEKSRAIREQLGTDDFVQNIARQGEILLAAGKFEEGMHALFKAEQLPAENPIFFSDIYKSIGDGLMQVQAYAKAIEQYKKAIQVLNLEGVDDLELQASYLAYLAKAYLKDDKKAEAAITIRNAQRLTYQKEFGIHADLAYLEAQLESGDYKILLLEQADNLYQKYRGPHNVHSAKALSEIVATHIEQQEWEDARMVLSIAKSRIDPMTAMQMEQAYTLLDYGMMAHLLWQESVIQLAICKGDACTETRKEVLQQLQAATQLMLMEQWIHPSYEGNRMILDLGVETALNLSSFSPDKSYDQLAFYFAEASRKLSTRKYLRPQLLYDWEKKHTESLEAYYTWRANILAYRAKPGLSIDLSAATKAWEAAKSQLKEDNMALYQRLFMDEVMSIKQIQGQLKASEKMLYYHLGTQDLYLFVIDNQSFNSNLLETKKMVMGPSDQLGERYLFPALISFQKSLQQEDYLGISQYGAQLYDFLLRPAANQFSSAGQLIIVPDPALQSLNFGALLSKKKTYKRPSYHKMAFLGKQFQVSYLPSASAFSLSGNQPPVATGKQKWMLTNPLQAPLSLQTSYDKFFDQRYQFLPEWEQIGREETTIRNLSDAGTFAEFARELPSVEEVNRIDQIGGYISDVRIWQLNSRVLINETNPELTSVVARDEFGEGWLIFFHELFVQRPDINCEMVLLNQSLNAQESLITPLLNYGPHFIVSGVDADKMALLKVFAEQLKEGQTVKDAIWYAQQKLMSKRKTAHPKNWASIRIYGR